MSGGVLLAVVAVLAGSVISAVGTAALARANPTQRIPRRDNQGWWRYQGFCTLSLFLALFGILWLQNEVGLWTLAPTSATFIVPQVIVSAAHHREVAPRTADR